MKENSKDTRRGRYCQAPVETKEANPYKSFIEEMRGEFKSLKDKFETNVEKIDKAMKKIEKLENHNNKTAKETKIEFKTLRQEMAEIKLSIEENVKKSVIDSLKPTVNNFQTKVKTDLNKLVREKVHKAQKPFHESLHLQPHREHVGSISEVMPLSSLSKCVPPSGKTLQDESDKEQASPAKEKFAKKKKKKNKKVNTTYIPGLGARPKSDFLYPNLKRIKENKESESEEVPNEESWAERCGKVVGQMTTPKSHKSPPMIDLNKLGKEESPYKSRKE